MGKRITTQRVLELKLDKLVQDVILLRSTLDEAMANKSITINHKRGYTNLVMNWSREVQSVIAKIDKKIGLYEVERSK